MLGEHMRHLVREQIGQFLVRECERQDELFSDKQLSARHGRGILVALATEVGFPRYRRRSGALILNGGAQSRDGTPDALEQYPIRVQFAVGLERTETFAISEIGSASCRARRA